MSFLYWYLKNLKYNKKKFHFWSDVSHEEEKDRTNLGKQDPSGMSSMSLLYSSNIDKEETM